MNATTDSPDLNSSNRANRVGHPVGDDEHCERFAAQRIRAARLANRPQPHLRLMSRARSAGAAHRRWEESAEQETPFFER
mgnify:CR=1 FL=1